MSGQTNAGIIDPFAVLVGKKLLLPSAKTRYVAVEMGFLVDMLRSRVEQIHVDEKWYLDGNPDVGIAVKDGVLKDAREHFATAGFYEHRLPYEILVDEAWYLDEYEDIGAAVRDGIFPSGQVHFERLGYGEGRLPYRDFRLVHAESVHDAHGGPI